VKSRIPIISLSVLLVGSNIFWAYSSLDFGLSYTYLEMSYDDARRTALQALALLPEAARPGVTREVLVAVASRIQPNSEPFEKEGFVWVGNIGLRFDSAGRLLEAQGNPAISQ
jgi:hypothetical protein